jgi:hypothetical protein
LQQKINTLSGIAGFRPLIVDGFIGNATVAALAALKKIGLATAPSTKEAAAANVGMLIDLVGNLVAQQQVMGKTLAPPGTAVAYQQPPGTAPTLGPVQILMPSTAAALPKLKSKTLWWIAGGLAAVLTVGGVGYVVYRRKARS